MPGPGCAEQVHSDRWETKAFSAPARPSVLPQTRSSGRAAPPGSAQLEPGTATAACPASPALAPPRGCPTRPGQDKVPARSGGPGLRCPQPCPAGCGAAGCAAGAPQRSSTRGHFPLAFAAAAERPSRGRSRREQDRGLAGADQQRRARPRLWAGISSSVCGCAFLPEPSSFPAFLHCFRQAREQLVRDCTGGGDGTVPQV